MTFQIPLSTSKSDYIMAMIKVAQPMIARLARQAQLEKEDCEQEAVIAMISALDRLSGYKHPVTNLNAYLLVSVRNHLIKIMKSHEYTVSLDVPCSSEDPTLYSELLIAPVQGDLHGENGKEEALYAALKRLPLEQQTYARERYELNAFNPVPPDWQTKVNYSQRKDRARTAMLRRLRRDPELLALFPITSEEEVGQCS